MDTQQTVKVEYIKKKGIALTRLGGNTWLIDHKALVITDEQVPKECLSKEITTQMFEFNVPVNDDNKRLVQLKVEETFKSFCLTNDIKYKSKIYYKFQSAFINGAIAVLGEIPPKWGIALMSNREVIEDYTVKPVKHSFR